MFGTKEGIKKLIDTHGILTRRQITVVKNDKVRIRAVCKGSMPQMNQDGVEPSQGRTSCPWVLHISKGKNDAAWMVKTYVDTHKRMQSRTIRACTAGFLSQEISHTLVHNPTVPVTAIQVDMQRKYELNVSKMKTFRAKSLAMAKLRGDYVDQ